MGETGSDPPHSDQYARQSNDDTWAKAIDKISVNRKQSRLSDYEKSEGPLNCIQAGMQTPGQVRRKQRPGVLQIGDGQHRDGASDEYKPSGTAWIVFLRCGHTGPSSANVPQVV